jgi:hypothetical protein
MWRNAVNAVPLVTFDRIHQQKDMTAACRWEGLSVVGVCVQYLNVENNEWCNLNWRNLYADYSQNRVAGVWARLGEFGGIVVRLLPGSRDFFLRQSIETSSGAYLVSQLVGPRPRIHNLCKKKQTKVTHLKWTVHWQRYGLYFDVEVNFYFYFILKHSKRKSLGNTKLQEICFNCYLPCKLAFIYNLCRLFIKLILTII